MILLHQHGSLFLLAPEKCSLPLRYVITSRCNVPPCIYLHPVFTTRCFANAAHVVGLCQFVSSSISLLQVTVFENGNIMETACNWNTLRVTDIHCSSSNISETVQSCKTVRLLLQICNKKWYMTIWPAILRVIHLARPWFTCWFRHYICVCTGWAT